MSFYIETNTGGFISGLYAHEADAKAGIKRFIDQSAKRMPTDRERRDAASRLNQSLKIVRNADSLAPSYLADELAAEVWYRIANDSVGMIYTRPLLISLARTRIIGRKGEYWEVTPLLRSQALEKLLTGKTGPLIENLETETITRTKAPFVLAGVGNRGLFKSYLPRY